MSRPLIIDINEEVFKIKDPRIDKVKAGLLSAEGLSFLISDRDPFVMIGHTIYALTEQEFYALRAIYPINEITEEGFHKILEMNDLSFMHQVDRDFIAKVREDLPHCPKCRYKRHQDEVYKLAKKYNIKLLGEIPGETESDVNMWVPYPETSGPIISYVSALLDHMYKVPRPVRLDCLDCVEKHVSQAWVLGNEALMGYPTHIAMAVAHLGEALDEMPKEYHALFDTLEFCLAKTNIMKRAFIPLGLILPLITMARNAAGTSFDNEKDDVTDTRSTVMEIDFTFDMREELTAFGEAALSRLHTLIMDADKIILEYKKDPSDRNRIIWEGSLACAADSVVQVAPKFANMLRNRRMLFVADPGLAGDSGYRFTDVIMYLETLKGN